MPMRAIVRSDPRPAGPSSLPRTNHRSSPIGPFRPDESRPITGVMGFIRYALGTAVALVALAGPASASGPPEAGCAVFPWVQTYRGWGPSDHYGSTVTVVYDSASCQASEEAGVAHLEVSGTATVIKGSDSDGKLLARAGFSNKASWTADEGDGWPIKWWSCDVSSLDYVWAIEGVYSFSMKADDGRWSIRVTPGGVDWSYAGC